MAEIERYTGNLQAPAVNAAVDKRGTFGDPSGPASDTLDDNLNTDLLQGWGIVGPSENPTIQDFNSMGFTLGQIHAYLHQVGVPEWDSFQEYYAGKSITNVGGVLYRCLINDVGTNPVGDLTGVWAVLDQGIGVEQAWQDLTASRSSGVNYTNTSGRSIAISVERETALGSSGGLDVIIDGLTIYGDSARDNTFINIMTAFAIIPNGAVYSVVSGASVTITAWSELRA